MELIDIYDVDGAPTGKKVPIDTSKETLELGEYIGVSQVFIQNKRGEFLIERSAKKTGYQYLPVGGHIMASEDPIKAVIRETREEIGLDLDDTLIDTNEKIKIYWKEYYKKHPNKEYTEEVPYNINFFGYSSVHLIALYNSVS